MGKKGRMPLEERRKRKAEKRQRQKRESYAELLESWGMNYGSEREWRMFFDGATGPTNPGQSGYGAVLYRNGQEVDSRSQQIGHATSNTAEYRGLIAGLEMALSHSAEELIVCGDSQLVLKQTFRGFGVLTPHLKPLCDRARELAGQFKFVADAWIRRECNQRADELSTRGLPQFERKFNRPDNDKAQISQCLKTILENPGIIQGGKEAAFVARVCGQLDGPRGWCTPKQWKWLQDIEARLYRIAEPATFNSTPRLVKQHI